MTVTTGTVKWFSDAKGFGFIEGSPDTTDVFVHFSVIQMDGFRTLRPGDRVSYQRIDGPKGSYAQHVVLNAEEQPCPSQSAETTE